MPIIVKANDKTKSANDLIRRFKKAAAATDIVQRTRDRRFNQKPSKKRAIKKIEFTRLKRRMHKLKKTKNVSPLVIMRMTERLNNG